MKQKRKVIIAAFICAAALLIGWKIKPVELIDDKLLIDLDTAIVEAGWGQEGNPTDEPDDTKTENGDKDSDNTGITVKPNPDEKSTVTVSVRGEDITMDGVAVKDAAALRTRLSLLMESGSTVVLEDNYAEAHVYKDVFQVLEIMQTMKQIKLSEIAR